MAKSGMGMQECTFWDVGRRDALGLEIRDTQGCEIGDAGT